MTEKRVDYTIEFQKKYEGQHCGLCRYLNYYLIHIIGSNFYYCKNCIPIDVQYSNKYICYMGMVGYITLYGDHNNEIDHYDYRDQSCANSRKAANNLREAKTKHKL